MGRATPRRREGTRQRDGEKSQYDVTQYIQVVYLLRWRWGWCLEEVLASPASCFSALIVVIDENQLESEFLDL